MEESSVCKIYKQNEFKNDHFERKYVEECKTTPNEDNYSQKFKLGEQRSYCQ